MKRAWILFALGLAAWPASIRAADPAPAKPAVSGAPLEISEGKKEDLLRARKAIEAAIAADPRNSQLLLHLGFIDHKLGDLDAAQTAFEKVAAADPSETSAAYMLALIYEKKGLSAKAIEFWKACQQYSKDPNLLGIASKHLEELQAAKK